MKPEFLQSRLFDAILKDSLEEALKAIDGGEDINFKDRDGCSLLTNAIIENTPEIFSLLIKKGADVNLPDKKGYSPLHYCIFRNRLDFGEILIASGADIEQKTGLGKTPLNIAVFESKGRYFDFLDLLVEAGADPYAEDQYGNSAYSFAKKSKNTFFLKLIGKHEPE